MKPTMIHGLAAAAALLFCSQAQATAVVFGGLNDTTTLLYTSTLDGATPVSYTHLTLPTKRIV